MKSIISLTTDYGLKDHYVATFKVKLLKKLGNIPIIDISHSVNSYNLPEASLLIKSIRKHCPENTIHLIDIHHAGGNPQLIWIEYEKQYFVMPDNGMIGLIFSDCKNFPVYKIAYSEDDLRFMNMQDLYIQIAEKLIAKESIGIESTNYIESQNLSPIITGDSIHVSVIHIDQYYNVILNLEFEEFEKIRNGRRFEISIRNLSIINRISASYDKVNENELCCIINDAGFLELAMNQAKLAQLFSLEFGSKIIIEFI